MVILLEAQAVWFVCFSFSAENSLLFKWHTKIWAHPLAKAFLGVTVMLDNDVIHLYTIITLNQNVFIMGLGV